jgi:hypothetical protein
LVSSNADITQSLSVSLPAPRFKVLSIFAPCPPGPVNSNHSPLNLVTYPRKWSDSLSLLIEEVLVCFDTKCSTFLATDGIVRTILRIWIIFPLRLLARGQLINLRYLCRKPEMSLLRLKSAGRNNYRGCPHANLNYLREGKESLR